MRAELVHILPAGLRPLLSGLSEEELKLQELRLRTGRPLILVCGDGERFVGPDGSLSTGPENGYRVTESDLKEMLEYASGYSLYACGEELRQGFLTVPGGHRVGVAGRVVSEGGAVRGMQSISSLNVRLACQRKGCADRVLPWILSEDKRRVRNTLLISPPRCGKTTLLRDLIRQLSNGGEGRPGFAVGVADERSELAACCKGVPQNDVGLRTDVLDCCPKAEGLMMLIRSMSPQVAAVDEIGSDREVEAMKYAMNCGVSILATVHGRSFLDVQRKPAFLRLVEEGWFERYLVLKFPERGENVKEILDAAGVKLAGAGCHPLSVFDGLQMGTNPAN